MNESSSLIKLIENGGVFSDIQGTTPLEILTNLVKVIKIPDGINRDELLKAVLERETLMPTAVGKGIALPHPRNPIITNPDDQFIIIGFLKYRIDWKALDGKPVHSIFLIVSSSAKLHLHTLSRINFFCQEESFRSLLESRASKEKIIQVIEETEIAWGH